MWWGDPALPDPIDCGLADDVPLDALRGPAGAEDGTDDPAEALRRLLSGAEPNHGRRAGDRVLFDGSTVPAHAGRRRP